MKIRFTNPDMTECVITKGIFRRRSTALTREEERYLKPDRYWHYQDGDTYSANFSGDHPEYLRNAELKRRKEATRWLPETKLPQATALKGLNEHHQT